MSLTDFVCFVFKGSGVEVTIKGMSVIPLHFESYSTSDGETRKCQDILF